MKKINRQLKEFEDFGYKVIHIIGNLYLIRKYSKNYKKVSIYNVCVKKEETKDDKRKI